MKKKFNVSPPVSIREWDIQTGVPPLTTLNYHLARTAALAKIEEEYVRARKNHKPMNSSHEAYGVILEEVDEMWDEIKKNNLANAKTEAIQVAAMILAFLLEVN